MTVSVKVNGTDNSVSHKGAMHFAKNTAPDVCKTPSPGGPVPIPYPVIISLSSDLTKGTTTVKADGGNMIAIKGSEYSQCSGDEAGTAGGVVSSTNMKEATWILYSFDVKFDGSNACRKTDKMKMNHGNTICLGGNDGPPLKPEAFLKKIMCKCAKAAKTPKPTSCTAYGNEVDACCQKAIKDHQDSGDPPATQGEQGYNPNGTKSSQPRSPLPEQSTGEFFKAITGLRFPDAASLDADGKVTQFFDFKAKCPKGTPIPGGKKRKAGVATGRSTPGWSPGKRIKRGKNKGKMKPGQKEQIKKLGRQQKPPVKKPPKLITNVGCK
ncbi:MAG: DUF4150 domain-containing protein, partial [Acidobacteriota bacterium]